MSQSLDELLKALEAVTVAGDDTDGFMSRAEWSDELGWSGKRTLDAFATLKKAGRLEVKRRTEVSLVGARCYVPVYRVKP